MAAQRLPPVPPSGALSVSDPEIVETRPSVEYPILRATVLAEQGRTQHPQQAAAEAVPGVDQGQLVTSLYALCDDKYSPDRPSARPRHALRRR
jgi:hypothetical protein